VRQKSFIFLAVALLVLLAGAVGVYAYDASRDDLIADGVSADGVDLSGKRAAAARVALEDQLATPLGQPLVVKHGKRRFRLTAAEADLRVDTERMVQEALDKSREGNVVSRTLREVTGGEPDGARLPARVSYSEEAVAGLVERVESALNQDPVDASVTFSGSSLGTVDGEPGVEVKADKLRNAIESELVLPAADRVVEVSTREVQPEVTRDELATKYPVAVTVDRASFKLHLWKNLELQKTYTVAIGAIGYDTPSGLYSIQNKAVDPAWTMPNSDWVAEADRGKVIPGGVPENPLKARWLGIYNGAGIHGTDATYSLGSAASHGCVRMAIPDVIELYDQVPIGAPVYIA
jgi:lipoprotein-anchoring transpeptidase ErfK/SrfK